MRQAPGRRQGQPDRARFTSRAAVLAVVICAIALSLAYPVREYIAQSRQISQLEAARQTVAAQLSKLEAEQRHLTSTAYVEQQARDKLHMCLPADTCYIIVNPAPPAGHAATALAAAAPWYERLWGSVERADMVPAR